MSSDDYFSEIELIFEERCKEINLYLGFIKTLSDSKVTHLARVENGTLVAEGGEIDRDLVKTLRANVFLLLYNLVESSMTSAIDIVHQTIAKSGLHYEALSNELRKVVEKNFKKAIRDGDSNLFSQDHPIRYAATFLGYDKNYIFSGNVDVDEIRQTARKYGFVSPDPNRNGEGNVIECMKNLKDKRNGLAHGRLSFREVGHETPIEGPEMMAKETIGYLKEVLSQVKIYLSEKKYLATGGD